MQTEKKLMNDVATADSERAAITRTIETYVNGGRELKGENT